MGRRQDGKSKRRASKQSFFSRGGQNTAAETICSILAPFTQVLPLSLALLFTSCTRMVIPASAYSPPNPPFSFLFSFSAHPFRAFSFTNEWGGKLPPGNTQSQNISDKEKNREESGQWRGEGKRARAKERVCGCSASRQPVLERRKNERGET